MSRAIALLVGVLFVVGSVRAAGAGDAVPKDAVAAPTVTEREQEIEELLKKPIEIELDEVSLNDAVGKFSEKAGVDIRIDQKAIVDQAIDASALVTFKTPKPMPLRDALREMLEDFELTTIIQYESLRITSKEKADGILTSRVYLVGDLVGSRAAGRPAMSTGYLIDMIEVMILPDWWDANSGMGTIIPSDMPGGAALLVSNTRDVHQQVAALLADLRAGKSVTPTGEAELETALKRPTTLDIVEISLGDAVAKIAEKYKLPITMDHKALVDQAVDESVLTSLTIRRPISLGAALDLLLDDFELTHVIQNGMIRITSKEKADALVKVRVYPVDDLVQAATVDRANEGQLAASVIGTIMPDCWDVHSGMGALRFFYGPKGWLAVVCNTDRIQREVVDLLASLRAARKIAAAAQIPAGAPAAPKPGATPTARLPPSDAPAAQPEAEEVDLKLVRYQLNYIDPEQAMQAITEMVSPRSWRAAGGTGTILVTKLTHRPTPGAPAPADQKPMEWTYLVVRQKPEVHRAIRKLLSEIDKPPPPKMTGMASGMMRVP